MSIKPILSIIQFNANQMNKAGPVIDYVEFSTGPAFIHLVCIKLYNTENWFYAHRIIG